jgi:hypothetical protein
MILQCYLTLLRYFVKVVTRIFYAMSILCGGQEYNNLKETLSMRVIVKGLLMITEGWIHSL